MQNILFPFTEFLHFRIHIKVPVLVWLGTDYLRHTLQLIGMVIKEDV
ncbi:MAG: hypothetical protein K0S76_717 [Herbinix sp.]|jgi:hypothetical protein|nr:hypothetical protein [Herbinix sp.]